MTEQTAGSSRRAYLAALAGVGIGGLAGCSTSDLGGENVGDDDADAGDGGDDAAATATAGNASVAASGPDTAQLEDVELPVPREELSRGARKDAIPAITEPAFGEDWSEFTASLDDDQRVIGVVRDGEARAYPLTILSWHEIVNDEFGGPLLVTYCPLCGSAMTAQRRVDGEPATFGVSGLLWNSDLVMYDDGTESLWSQIIATAIRGDRTGDQLTLVPSTLTTWGEWRGEHSATRVLLPPPESGMIVDAAPRNYDVDPYSGYADSARVGIGRNDFDDDRLHPKAEVIGVAAGGEAVAYPLETVQSEGVVNDTVGDRPVVVTTTPSDSLVAYVRVVDGSDVTVAADGPEHLAAAGSRWRRASGEAVDGPHEGTTLERANGRSQMYWFAWADFHEDTAVFGQGEEG